MQMSPGKLETSLKALAEERLLSDSHPQIETLVAYHVRELKTSDRETVQEHLAVCTECTQLLLDLANFSELRPPTAEFLPSEEQKSLDFPRAEASTEPKSKSKSSEKVVPFDRIPPSASRPATLIPFWYQMAAASVLFITLGLAFWVAALRQGNAELSERLEAARSAASPRLLYAIRDLEAIDHGPVRGSTPTDLRLPESADFYLLNLGLVETRPFSAYRVEISEKTGDIVFLDEVPQISPYGHFALEVPRDFLRPGEYEVRIHGLGESESDLISTYMFHISDP